MKPYPVSSLCPTCLQRIEGHLYKHGEDIILKKNCQEHGEFSTVIWRGTPSFSSWVRPKIPYRDGRRQTQPHRGCPFDCGLCHAHSQRTCTALLEITSRCDLGCPVCFAGSGSGPDLPLDELDSMLERIFQQTGGCNLQLSGGEPTLHPELPEIVALAKKRGFDFVQLNSNGLRLAEDGEFCRSLHAAGLSSVFLQFDGLDNEIFTTLRGRPLLAEKKQAIANLSAAGIGIVLVPVLVPGVNEHQLWELVHFGLNHLPHVRGIHFQPISYFGRYPREFSPRHITLPEIMTGLERQSGGILQASHFQPPGCEHALCSFSARYLLEENGRLRRLGTDSCRCTPQPALQGAIKSISITARQWRTAESALAKPADQLDRFLNRVKRYGFSISAMAFQDVWSLNLERLQGCCIHVATRDGRLIPFCSYNLTASSGRPLHRTRG